ncbi:hypothetical protein M885DRAFT_552835 [Pelagophyceae sp. CCMP2097]|nr:hypothetical protein M885DRAFT_552835 [Pelagophyceae sp. CCMP2097]
MGLWAAVRFSFALVLLRPNAALFGRRKWNESEVCQKCSETRPSVRAVRNLADDYGMAMLSQLAYVAWHREPANVSAGTFDVHARVLHGPGDRQLRLRAAEALARGGRRAACMLRRAAKTPQIPGLEARWPTRPSARATSGHACGGPKRWRLVWWFHDWFEPGPARTKWHATNVLLAESLDGEDVAVVFRGSYGAASVVTNLQTLSRPDRAADRAHGGRSLRGIRRAFEAVDHGGLLRLYEPPAAHARDAGGIYDGVAALCGRAPAAGACDVRRIGLDGVLEDFVGGALRAGRRVFSTGHSLGGALALQLALRALVPPAAGAAPARLAIVTFGEPEMGDAAFYAAHLRRRAVRHLVRGRYRRYVALSAPPQCLADHVTTISRPFGGGGHFTRPTYVCSPDSPWNAVAVHSVKGYAAALRDGVRTWLNLSTEVSPHFTNLTFLVEPHLEMFGEAEQGRALGAACAPPPPPPPRGRRVWPFRRFPRALGPRDEDAGHARREEAPGAAAAAPEGAAESPSVDAIA